jgi:hypothetical protein
MELLTKRQSTMYIYNVHKPDGTILRFTFAVFKKERAAE